MQVKHIAECSKGSILQYFRPSLSYHFSLRSLFCPFYTGFTVYITFLHMAITKIMLPNARLLMKFAQLMHNRTAGPTSRRLLSCGSLANLHDYLAIALHVNVRLCSVKIHMEYLQFCLQFAHGLIPAENCRAKTIVWLMWNRLNCVMQWCGFLFTIRNNPASLLPKQT